MTSTLEGRVAVVTGGSRGLGRAITLELVRRGVGHVVINFRRRDREAQLTLEQVRELGGEGSLHQADITDANQVQPMLQTIYKQHRRLDILINNAGITRDAYLLTPISMKDNQSTFWLPTQGGTSRPWERRRPRRPQGINASQQTVSCWCSQGLPAVVNLQSVPA